MLRIRIILVGLIILTLTAVLWGWSVQPGGGPVWRFALTPGMAVRLGVSCSQGTTLVPGSFRTTATRWVEDQAVVFYTASCQDGVGNPPIPLSGDAVVELGWSGWDMCSWSSGSGAPVNKPIQSLGASQQLAAPNADSYTIVKGTVGIPDVALVEVVMDDGEVVQDQPVNNAFVAYVPRQAEVHEIRLLDDAGQVLHQESMRFPSPPPPPPPPPPSLPPPPSSRP
jgi:hypothetical protein